MMADESVIIASKTESILQLRAASENLLLEMKFRSDGPRRITARSSQHHLSTRAHARYGIIGAHLDAPVMEEKVVGDTIQTFCRLALLITDRLVGDIAACHHERTVQTIEQKIM